MEVYEAAASSSSTWRGIMDSCTKICHDLKGVVDCSDSLLILHRSKWQCLARTYSTVIDSLTKQTEKAFSNLNQETLCQKLLLSLDVLHHAMQEGERCFKDCICKSSEINHSWLVEKALKLSMSADIIDIHLHDFIWAYATVKEQALWLGIHFDGMELPDLEEETSILCTIWAAEDTKSDLCTAQEQLLTNFMVKEEEETLHLAKFILNKITHTIEDKVDVESHQVLPNFLWVDPTSLKRNQDYIIANGSYGVVYEATWLRGRFAVKEISHPGEHAHSGREQAIQARLCHSNVINLVCCTRNPSSKRLCLVMELMQQDLQFLMKGRKQDGMDPPFTPLEAIDLMLQVAKGMEYLHSLNIIHRDLKSSNILVSFPPISNQQIRHHTHLKIADFGTAKAKEMDDSSFTTKRIGARAWRAPEVGSDGHAKYHKTADVYSFGVVCYEILTGELPFKETQHLDMRVMKGERPKLPNYCPSALASYIERCWDGNPAARPSFTCICRMLRYMKACILLENSHEGPYAPHNWLAHPVSSRACARITGMLDSSINALPRPLSILLEMYWCRIILQESHEDPGSSRLEGISDYTTTSSSSVEHHVEQVNGFSLESTRQEGISDYTTTPSSSVQHYVEQANGFSVGRPGRNITLLSDKFSRNLYMRPPTAQDEKLKLQSKVKKMTLKELQVATDNFNGRNMLGDNGFGGIYKGTLTSGRVVAVKKLDERHNKEFQNEMNLMNALRHRNLIQLLGYCAEDSERLLVFEFVRFARLDNRVFDNLLFGRRCEALDWAVRVKIIKGVAKGLCYLHEDAPCKIVHRDIKPMNILLDETMNPKIANFELARQFDDSCITTGIAGTPGYIAPEYIMTGEFTEKIDVYSFGILILETVSGQRRFQNGLDGLERAWSLFENEEEMQLLDPRMANCTEVRADEVKKVVHVALLCSQTEADERPSMSQVYTMLSNEAAYVPLPSKPPHLISNMPGSQSAM